MSNVLNRLLLALTSSLKESGLVPSQIASYARAMLHKLMIKECSVRTQIPAQEGLALWILDQVYIDESFIGVLHREKEHILTT